MAWALRDCCDDSVGAAQSAMTIDRWLMGVTQRLFGLLDCRYLPWYGGRGRDCRRHFMADFEFVTRGELRLLGVVPERPHCHAATDSLLRAGKMR